MTSAWQDALLIARLLANDTAGFGGVRVRGRPGPLRDSWLQCLRAALPPTAAWRRLPLSVDTVRLAGGLDLAATLAAGRPVLVTGLVAEVRGGVLVASMAERMAPSVIAPICAALDQSAVRAGATEPGGFAFVALDEGEDGESLDAALAERLAFTISLDGLAASDLDVAAPHLSTPSAVVDEAAALSGIVQAAQALGIESSRAPLFALRAARGLQRLAGRSGLTEGDLAAAARLVLGPRARQVPASDAAPPANTAPAEPAAESHAEALADRIVAAAAAVLPDAFWQAFDGHSRPHPARGQGSGARHQTQARGRPAGVRRGTPRAGARLALLETLRAAVPWQTLRGRREGESIRIRVDDLRVRRFVERAASTMILAVDASGSAAFERLAEAKGAAELLLADAYVQRSEVALVAFRGKRADLLLPPTRSLTRAKRCLGELPGGGGTPLAAGIDAAQRLADAVRGRGRTPHIIVMTDGRANVAMDGSGVRAQAEADALAAARRLRSAGHTALVIDISARQQTAATCLAEALGGRCLRLPRADALALRNVARAMTS
jgi:magnesium chelatase subunit D